MGRVKFISPLSVSAGRRIYKLTWKQQHADPCALSHGFFILSVRSFIGRSAARPCSDSKRVIRPKATQDTPGNYGDTLFLTGGPRKYSFWLSHMFRKFEIKMNGYGQKSEIPYFFLFLLYISLNLNKILSSHYFGIFNLIWVEFQLS